MSCFAGTSVEERAIKSKLWNERKLGSMCNKGITMIEVKLQYTKIWIQAIRAR